MAHMIVMAQRKAGAGMLVRGVFSQKKKVWEAMEKLEPALQSLKAFDDVTGTESPLNYSKMCNLLRVNGRAAITVPSGEKEFLLLETEVNSVRGWDVGEDGHPVRNPSADGPSESAAVSEETGNASLQASPQAGV